MLEKFDRRLIAERDFRLRGLLFFFVLFRIFIPRPYDQDGFIVLIDDRFDLCCQKIKLLQFIEAIELSDL